MGHLKATFDLIKQPFEQFVAEKSPDWIMIDAICSWTVDVAEECHVPAVIFSSFTATTHVFIGPPEYLVRDAQRRVKDKEGVRKWECLNGFLSLSSTHQTIGSVDDDEKSSSSATELQRVVSRRLQNDSTTLPNVQHQHLLRLEVAEFSGLRSSGCVTYAKNAREASLFDVVAGQVTSMVIF
ncbi:UDP-glycosyltransferase 91C1 [Camellia lanceoleosa]|uniref:UDP-glycosyltransferase 91C1 n=1 Tax=Camellia lanceoleosa TaxID=1840588 RepID=A0ACC0IF97_9ERIC|nr:UDP-glycosyltransferase 91C1 [Camellia lanceoleosa]